MRAGLKWFKNLINTFKYQIFYKYTHLWYKLVDIMWISIVTRYFFFLTTKLQNFNLLYKKVMICNLFERKQWCITMITVFVGKSNDLELFLYMRTRGVRISISDGSQTGWKLAFFFFSLTDLPKRLKQLTFNTF